MPTIKKSKTTAVEFHKLAETNLAKGKLNKAKAFCLKALNRQPNLAVAWKTMGDIMLAKGKMEAAKDNYAKAIAIYSYQIDSSSDLTESNQNFANAHANLGSLYAKQQQWEKAISYYNKSLSIEPNSASVYRDLAKVWQQMGKQDLVIECQKQALILEPENATASEYLNLGNNWLELDNKEEAIACYRQAIRLDNSRSNAYRKLGIVLLETGEIEEAIAMFCYGIRLNPNDAIFYKNLGDALRKNQQLEQAIAAYNMAVKFKPDNYLFHKKLGDSLQEKGNLNEAIICYQKAIEINPNFSVLYHQLGNAFSKQSRWNEAAAAYRKGIAINPDFYRFYYLLGNVLIQQLETLDEAVGAYLKAIELKPEFPWFSHYSSWKSIIKQGKITQLLNLYHRATQLNPDSIWCYVNLAEILTETGELKAAIASYKTACYNKTRKSHPAFVKKYWDIQNPSRPNFIIIGAQKSGTTSLENYIAQHPQVLPAIKKEIHFWYRDFDKGIDWYLAHFPPIPESSTKSINYLTGEATPNYLENWHSASKVFQTFPNIKLLVILRNPVDRAISQYHHWLRLKRENRSFEAAMIDELKLLKQTPHLPVGNNNYWQQEKNYIGRGLYAEFLQKWMEIFPREQFLIIRGEDLYQTPIATMKQVFDFLGLPEYQLPEYKKLNPGYYQPIDESTREILSDFFQPHNQRLEEFLGIKFNWS